MKIYKFKSAFTPTPVCIVQANMTPNSTANSGIINLWHRCANRCGGFTLVEMFICLAIVGIILTAVAFALDACVANYEANKNISDSVIKANQAISRITADLRCANDVAISEPINQCSMLTAEGDMITYLFNQGEGKLYLVKNGTNHILCEDISSVVFARKPDPYNPDKIISVQIILTVGTGNYARDACAAVVIRKNLQN